MKKYVLTIFKNSHVTWNLQSLCQLCIAVHDLKNDIVSRVHKSSAMNLSGKLFFTYLDPN